MDATGTETPSGDRLAQTFRATFDGSLVTPGDEDYDDVRQVWNAMVDARPAVIARCRNVDDIVAAVDLVREVGCVSAVRAGGHSVAGLSSCDGGVVIDLSGMRTVTVDPERRLATVAPGVTWADFDAATGSHGLASTGGLISTTGVAGLTLGGGIGWLQRRYGLACDNLVAAEMVTASGAVVRVAEDERPDLLWGLRGGGGNFGVVSTMTFSLHSVSTVLGGLMMWPLARGNEVLESFATWAADLPDDGSMLAAVLTAPPEPFVPASLVGQKVVAVVGCWCGDIDAGQQQLARLRALEPAVDLFSPMPYPGLQQMLDGGGQKGLRNYFRSGFLDSLGTPAIDVVLEHAARMPSPMSQLHLHQMGGAVARVADDATAFGYRRAAYTYNVLSTWEDPLEDDEHMVTNRAFASALAPLSEGRSYVNFLTERDDEAVRAAYGGASYERLARLKAEYDPQNLFRTNQNVLPAS